MVKKYQPQQGDLIYLNFNPQVGKEQAGRRPALVISVDSYNQKSQLLVCCPITSQIKGYPFEVVLSKRQSLHGAVLSDQLRTIDWNARSVSFIEKIAHPSLQEVKAKIVTLCSLSQQN